MLRALLLVAREIALAHDQWLARLARRRPLAAEIAALRETVGRQRAQIDLLRARLRRLHPRRRPRYRAWERLAILWHRARYGLSVSATARAFVLSAQTIINWNREVDSGRARLVQAKPPVNRLPDLVREITHRLKGEWPRWGTRRIAGILARLGMKASRSSVQRALRERPPRPAGGGRILPRRAGELLAKRPNHIWLVDFTASAASSARSSSARSPMRSRGRCSPCGSASRSRPPRSPSDSSARPCADTTRRGT